MQPIQTSLLLETNSYTDVADAKIVAIDGGHILLNGGKDGNLNTNGQFTATGLTGGKIDFRGKTLSLSGAKLDASGKNGGGTILIGGDYQGIDPTGLNTLANARSPLKRSSRLAGGIRSCCSV